MAFIQVRLNHKCIRIIKFTAFWFESLGIKNYFKRLIFGRLAQLVRALRLHRRGLRFESLIAHNTNSEIVKK